MFRMFCKNVFCLSLAIAKCWTNQNATGLGCELQEPITFVPNPFVQRSSPSLWAISSQRRWLHSKGRAWGLERWLPSLRETRRESSLSSAQNQSGQALCIAEP